VRGLVIAKPSSYRPEIDGLRAIAVIAVIVNHINGSYLPGGFLGVDIFFVISGYVITAEPGPTVSDVLPGLGWMQRLVEPGFAQHPTTKMRLIFRTITQSIYSNAFLGFTQVYDCNRWLCPAAIVSR
jgi:hypothetical protein